MSTLDAAIRKAEAEGFTAVYLTEVDGDYASPVPFKFLKQRIPTNWLRAREWQCLCHSVSGTWALQLSGLRFILCTNDAPRLKIDGGCLIDNVHQHPGPGQ